MVYLILVIIAVSIIDIRKLALQKRIKDLAVYAAVMLLVTAFGIFYFSDPERKSFSNIVLSLLKKEG
jgi:multisubunit Na+/H+ antiporter MnhB subunit